MANRSNINLNAYATVGQDVGTGTTVYAGKCDINTLQFKTISTQGNGISLNGDSENLIISGQTGGIASWGSVTGTLSNQTDLQTALDLKLDVNTFSGYSATTLITLNDLRIDLDTVSGQTDTNTSNIDLKLNTSVFSGYTATTETTLTDFRTDLDTVSGQTDTNTSDIVILSGKTIDNLNSGILEYNSNLKTFEPYSNLQSFPSIYSGTTCPTGLTRMLFNASVVATEFRASTANTNTTHLVGDIYWDTDDQAITIQQSANVAQQVGQESYVYVKNDSGSGINNGDVVFINGADGNRPTIELARASASDGSIVGAIIGVVTEDIPDGNNGYVTSFGLVKGLNITDLSGTPLYVSTTSSGDTQTIKPTSPDYAIKIGVVTKTDGIDGRILVSVTNETDLTGVTVTANNGLTKVGNNISLGGILTESTTIDVGTDNQFSILAAKTAQGSSSIYVNEDNNLQFTVYTAQTCTGIGSRIYMNPADATIEVNGAGGDLMMISLDDSNNNQMLVEDSIYDRGLEYAACYHDNYTSRSLVDAGYVTGLTNGLQLQIDSNDADITYLSGQTDLKLLTTDFNSYTGTTDTTLTGLRTDIDTVSGCTSGTADYLAKFNSTGDGVEDSSILETTDINILNNTLSIGVTGDSTCKTIKASNHATSTVDLIVSPGENLSNSQDGCLFLNPGRTTSCIFLGSPAYSGNTVAFEPIGACSFISTQLKVKNDGAIFLTSGCRGILFTNDCLSVCLKGDILGLLSCNNLNIKGYSTTASGASGCNISIMGGTAQGLNSISGGDVIICAGKGTVSDGNIVLDGEAHSCCVYYPQSLTSGGAGCANLPAPSASTGGMLYVSDCIVMAWSDGTNWLDFKDGNPI